MDGGSGLTVAVIITAIIGIFTLIINRGMKVSEFRQAWINDQRADLAKWGAAALTLARQNSLATRAADFTRLEETAYRIRLRENPTKPEWADVLTKMDSVRTKLIDNPTTAIEIFPDVKDIADEAQVRLKRDWNKVRNGEVGYKVLCFLFPALFGVLLVMTVWAFRPDLNPFGHEPAEPVEQHLTGSVRLIEPEKTVTPVKALPSKPTEIHRQRG
jgi:hypothetical protein